jgi:hypothetical protein
MNICSECGRVVENEPNEAGEEFANEPCSACEPPVKWPPLPDNLDFIAKGSGEDTPREGVKGWDY